ncbi:hypothetical protein [Streptomyces sp. NBC_01187]|uniref:hypothetical protein n=1 Tax=Streptomyces sp. NBC_01187 TaxID=2903766 RepID=UPI00386A5BA1|nr:hypothetical protein OG220_32380 [Streptomyces sp. NBC_01187]
MAGPFTSAHPASHACRNLALGLVTVGGLITLLARRAGMAPAAATGATPHTHRIRQLITWVAIACSTSARIFA